VGRGRHSIQGLANVCRGLQVVRSNCKGRQGHLCAEMVRGVQECSVWAVVSKGGLRWELVGGCGQRWAVVGRDGQV
jgi:hypothetical protein